ncbi:hypothetical protein HAX54_032004, partial [Datura stramonium]|nr:hypothetical protein [Datura stramonium]
PDRAGTLCLLSRSIGAMSRHASRSKGYASCLWSCSKACSSPPSSRWSACASHCRSCRCASALFWPRSCFSHSIFFTFVPKASSTPKSITFSPESISSCAL